MKTLLRTLGLAIGLAFCIAGQSFAANSAPPSAPPAPPGGAGGTLIEDRAVWDVTLFKIYCKEAWQVDVKDNVAPYPGQNLITADFNPEFVRRLNALISYYQATGHNDIGIVPGDGAYRSPHDQHELYKIGRVTKDGAKDSDDQADWVEPDPPGKVKPVTGVWIGWHDFGLASDFCQYEGAVPKVVPVPGNPGKFQTTLPFLSNDWNNTFDRIAPALGFIWGGRWHAPHDPGHLEWHPARHNPENMEVTGVPDPEFNDLYTSKIPQSICFWSSYKSAGKQNHLLYVYTLVYVDHWVTVSKSRSIWQDDAGEWTGVWTTYDPPAKIFPGYVPVRDMHVSGRDKAMIDQFAFTTKVSSSVFANQPKIRDDLLEYSSTVVTAKFCPSLLIHDWQSQAIMDIDEASPPPKPPASLEKTNPALYKQILQAHNNGVNHQKTIRAMYALCENHSVYDVEGAAIPVVTGKDQPYAEYRGIIVEKDHYTRGDPDKPDQEPYTPLGPALHFAWVRPDGRIGVPHLSEDQKSQYDPLVITTKRSYDKQDVSFLVVSPTVPDGAFDQSDPPTWPKPNPKPPPDQRH